MDINEKVAARRAELEREKRIVSGVPAKPATLAEVVPGTLRRSKLASLVQRQVQRERTPGEKLIGTGGVLLCLLLAFTWSSTAWLFCAGFAAYNISLNIKYFNELKLRYPQIFEELGTDTYLGVALTAIKSD